MDHPILALSICLAISFGLSALPILVVRRLPAPDPDRVLLRIPYRLWVGRYLRVIMPGFILGGAIAVAAVCTRFGWALARLHGAAIGAATGIAITMPVLCVAWALHRLFSLAAAATTDALFVSGTFIPWSRIASLDFEKHGLVLDIPSARFVRRQALLYRTFRIDAYTRARLSALHAAAHEGSTREWRADQ